MSITTNQDDLANRIGTQPHELITFTNSRSVPLILQTEVTECGLACVGMIASYFGHKVNLPALRNIYHIGSHGMSLNDISDVGSKLGLSSRALKCDLDELGELKVPAILHWDLDHFVVLTSVKRNRIYINDPGVGKRILTLDEASKHFTGIALELTPVSTFKKVDDRILMKVNDLWKNMVGLKRSLTSLLFISLVLQFLLLTTPYYTQWIVDKVLLTSDTSLLLVLAIAFSIIVALQVAVQTFRSWVVIRISNNLSIQMGANLFHHLIRLPIDYFLKRHFGDISSRFGSLSNVQELLTNGIIEVVVDGLMAILILVMMFLYSPLLTCIVIVVLILAFAIQWAFYFPSRRIQEELINEEAREQSAFLETLRAMQTIKLYNQENHRSSLWLNRNVDVINSSIRLAKLDLSEAALIKIISGLEMIFVLYFGALAVIEQSLTVGMLLAFIAYKSMFNNSVYQLIDLFFDFKFLGLHLERLSDITLHKQEDDNKDYVAVGQTLQGKLSVNNLSLRYSQNSDYVFENISFEVMPGESVAIVGPSGCGKSSLMKAMLRILEYEQGYITFDGVDINRFNLSDYRSKIGTVMQDDTLLSGSLLDNITMFDANYDEHHLQRCCEVACLDNFLEQLPMGINTLVGDMGSSLSGGQIQRVLLARALYGSPDVLLLDESTSNLDQKTLLEINENITALNITRILIAHRPETIASADRVVQLCFDDD
ncbi:ABC transporter ATP-binding protein [Vibrio ponticus]|uniref:ABC transporter ATP-binding protein n=1 Tax=Vibrio ponticus TaxID=265668 RepID=A0ABX3FL13_9VIBR|nr:peptidase domain-containing ABC transporter [Vibrio ponticus]OLQ93764.1 ABC transporter ATP-binding protein [Vibrio ponticus]